MPDGAPPFALPEFTRSLRAFASPAALASSEQGVLFGPLLSARKSAERVQSAEGRLAAFDANRLRGELQAALDGLARRREPRSEPDRRALSALLDESAIQAHGALDALAAAAAAVRAAAGDEARAAMWPAWTAAVQVLFDAVDQILRVLLGEPSPTNVATRPPGPPRAPTSPNTPTAPGATIVVLALALSAVAAPLAAQHVTLRVSAVRPESLLARGFDVVGTERNEVLVVANPRDRARLAQFGWTGTEVRPRPAAALSGTNVPALYRDYDDSTRGVRAFIDSVARMNSRVSVDTIGVSYEKRPMLAVKIGPRGDSPSRPNVIFVATYHAREWAATEMALRLITYLATTSNARVDSLLQTRDVWVIPVANPDGYEFTFTGDRLWRKTRSPQAGGAIGVDMNRNHRASWGLDDHGSSPDPQSDIFRGPSPASEIETRNIEAFHAAHPPVVAMTYHTYAGLLLFPPGDRYGDVPADLPVYQTLAGTNARSAVVDHLPGSARTVYSPAEAWMLYTTNGDYTDFTTQNFGTVSFTAELSSGYGAGGYYGFEFPADTAALRQLFEDNLPFALDLIESARDPSAYYSASTGRRPPVVQLESMSPDVRVTVPAALAAGASLATGSSTSFRLDSTAGAKWFRRLVASGGPRPPQLRVTLGGASQTFSALGYGGAESRDTGWTLNGFRRDSTAAFAGKYSWNTPATGELRSPRFAIPPGVDTVSLLFWTRYLGSGFVEVLNGKVRVSTDGGTTFSVAGRVQGYAPTWYPEHVTVGGVAGKSVVFSFTSDLLDWWIDEVAVVAHGTVQVANRDATIPFQPSENPVKRSVVWFQWPFGDATGDLHAYDITGRLLWKAQVTDGGPVRWDLAAAGLPNGVYVVIARSAGRTQRLKLFVTRDGR